MKAGAVSVRLDHGGPQGAKPKAEVVADILASIKERRAGKRFLTHFICKWATGSKWFQRG